VSGYGLGHRAIEVRSLEEVKGIFPPMGTGGPFPGGEARPGRDADHSPPSRAEVVNGKELHLLSPLRLHSCVVGLLYLFIISCELFVEAFNYERK
jgi:hypothetical protein